MLVLVAGGSLGWLVRSARIQREAVDAKENRQISEWMAARATTSQPAPLNMVGNLAAGYYYESKGLLLTEEQNVVITRLDKLVRKSHYRSFMADAEPFDGPPAVRRRHLAHNNERRREAIHRAQRLVFLGLLTEAQAAFVTPRYLESMGMMGALNNDVIGVAEQLGFTESQRGELAKVNARFLQQSYANVPDSKSPVRDILTPSQLDRWSELTSQRSLPVEPPKATRSALSKAEVASVHIEDLSPVFRALAETASAFGLSAEQKALVKDLEEVTRVGFVWIGRRDAESVPQLEATRMNQAKYIPQVRAEFLHLAEQVALLGILTKHQAQQVQAAVMKN
jgi:hypothetical protein